MNFTANNSSNGSNHDGLWLVLLTIVILLMWAISLHAAPAPTAPQNTRPVTSKDIPGVWKFEMNAGSYVHFHTDGSMSCRYDGSFYKGRWWLEGRVLMVNEYKVYPENDRRSWVFNYGAVHREHGSYTAKAYWSGTNHSMDIHKQLTLSSIPSTQESTQ